MNNKHHRHSIRLRDFDYSSCGAYFVTICTENKGNALGEITDGEMELNEFGEIARECWLDLPNHYDNIKLAEFIVMPNHVHFIIVIKPSNAAVGGVGAIHELPLRNERNVYVDTEKYRIERRRMLLPKIIGRFKMVSAKRINRIRGLTGVKFWQRNYYEHVIRTEADLNAIRQYIIDNPANWEDDEYYV